MIASLCPDWMLGNNVICARRIASGLSRLSSHTESPTQLCFLQDSFLRAITIVNRMLQSYEPNHSRVLLTQVLAGRTHFSTSKLYSPKYTRAVLTRECGLYSPKYSRVVLISVLANCTHSKCPNDLIIAVGLQLGYSL